jgi:ATP-binding cassette subfamily F protein 3
VLSGGERTRLAVARMLLRPSNTLLLDEPTNHLDLDSKDVLLEALADYGGTLILVSHDRYFVERLATKIVEVGHGDATVYPGTYAEFLWSKTHREEGASRPAGRSPKRAATPAAGSAPRAQPASGQAPSTSEPKLDREDRKRVDGERRKKQRAAEALQRRIAELETRIAASENEVKALEATMASTTFYADPGASKPVIERHQALMWEVGELMSQWEALQQHAAEAAVDPS